MEKELIRELDRTYLVVANGNIDEDEYVIRMAMKGRLPGILPLTVTSRNGMKSLRADVTACTSIASRFKSIELTGSDMRKILASIRDTAQKMPGLLMSASDLYLDPECVFLGPGGDDIRLCYIPHVSDTEPDSVRLLSEFLLKKLDHSDQAAASLAYSLYDKVSAPSCVLNEVLSDLLHGICPDSVEKDNSSYVKKLPPPGCRHQAAENIPYGKARGSGNTSRYSGSGDFHEYAGPANSSRRTGSGKSSRRAGSGNSSRRAGSAGSSRHTGAGRIAGNIPVRQLIPAIIILSCACTAIIIFGMDLTQILGMGFLCAALIWMIHASLEKRANEMRNDWFDDDDDLESDDQFYQSLRNELYSEDLYKEKQPDERTQLLKKKNCPVLVSLQKDLCPDIDLDRDHMILGKSSSQSNIVLPGDTISRRHVRIERRMDGYYATDMFSTNGTFLDGRRLESGQAAALMDGAELTVASLHFRVMIPPAGSHDNATCPSSEQGCAV